jgi:formate dehydrogenase major subunit
MRSVDSVCTYCGVGCEITADINISENIISRIYSKEEAKVSNGDLCLKGKEGFSFLTNDKRIDKTIVSWKFIENNWNLCKDLDLDLSSPTIFQNQLFYAINNRQVYKLVARKISEITNNFGKKSFSAIGGARTSCESGFLFQKFTREVIQSPHVDNCARVCHSPSLRGLRATIGEGASTNPFNDIENAEFIILIGSNITEAHPIVGNKLLNAKKAGKLDIATIDIRETQIFKNSKYGLVIPFEANLLIINMIARVIIEEKLENYQFISDRTKYYLEFRDSILNDKFADPDFFKNLAGYEDLPDLIRKVARDYATKKSMILWGLGVTEHFDGSYAVMALSHLALLTGNIGKSGAGLMPLRGQNNVQGTCDVGMLPYYLPDYERPKEIGMMTPQIFDSILSDDPERVRIIWNMGEDLAHIHANQNKVQEALSRLDLLIVNEVMASEVTKFAHIVFGVKSTYEKYGVYVNAERRLHLSQPLIKSNLPDDWEVIQGIENELSGDWSYNDSEDVWNDVRIGVKNRYGGVTYDKLKENILSGLQWPMSLNSETDTPILHLESFRTKDGIARFYYHSYKLRGQIEELLNFGKVDENYFYLSTGRAIAHYNNSAQTKATDRLYRLHSQDVLIYSIEDREFFGHRKSAKLKSQYSESSELILKQSKRIKSGTLFVTFHHPESRVNFLFGDEGDELIGTSKFKSIRVEVI